MTEVSFKEIFALSQATSSMHSSGFVYYFIHPISKDWFRKLSFTGLLFGGIWHRFLHPATFPIGLDKGHVLIQIIAWSFSDPLLRCIPSSLGIWLAFTSNHPEWFPSFTVSHVPCPRWNSCYTARSRDSLAACTIKKSLIHVTERKGTQFLLLIVSY